MAQEFGVSELTEDSVKTVAETGKASVHDFLDVNKRPVLIVVASKHFPDVIDPSITVLKKLTFLDLEECQGLKSLPASMAGLESLEVLLLTSCRSLDNLPKDLGCLNKLERLDVSDTRLIDIPSSIGDLKALKSLSCSYNFSISSGWIGLSSAGLYSLEKLDLCFCSLSDEDFPDDFGCLVSLKYLNLSRNQFSCLPDSFNRLSKLKDLNLSGCRYLKSLGPELPDSLEMVRVAYCNELHTSLDPSSHCNLRCSAICTDCFNLVNRQGSKRTAMASLGRYLQNPPRACKRFDIVLPLPGDEILSWFTHQVRGSSWFTHQFRGSSSISLPLNPNWCTNKWMGFALSVCCTGSEDHWEIKINQQDWGFGSMRCETFAPAKSPHLWLLYLPRDTYFRREWQNKGGDIQFSFNRRSSFHWEECNIISCGVRLVYEHDIEQLNLMLKREELNLNQVCKFLL